MVKNMMRKLIATNGSPHMAILLANLKKISKISCNITQTLVIYLIFLSFPKTKSALLDWSLVIVKTLPASSSIMFCLIFKILACRITSAKGTKIAKSSQTSIILMYEVFGNLKRLGTYLHFSMANFSNKILPIIDTNE